MFDDATYRAVILGAWLHDFGKLLQQGTFQQIAVCGQHPNICADFVSAFQSFFVRWVAPDLLKTLLRHHHENPQHFPSGLLAQDTPDPHQRALVSLGQRRIQRGDPGFRARGPSDA